VSFLVAFSRQELWDLILHQRPRAGAKIKSRTVGAAKDFLREHLYPEDKFVGDWEEIWANRSTAIAARKAREIEEARKMAATSGKGAISKESKKRSNPTNPLPKGTKLRADSVEDLSSEEDESDEEEMSKDDLMEALFNRKEGDKVALAPGLLKLIPKADMFFSTFQTAEEWKRLKRLYDPLKVAEIPKFPPEQPEFVSSAIKREDRFPKKILGQLLRILKIVIMHWDGILKNQMDTEKGFIVLGDTVDLIIHLIGVIHAERKELAVSELQERPVVNPRASSDNFFSKNEISAEKLAKRKKKEGRFRRRKRPFTRRDNWDDSKGNNFYNRKRFDRGGRRGRGQRRGSFYSSSYNGSSSVEGR
jgi:hypothetical protein